MPDRRAGRRWPRFKPVLAASGLTQPAASGGAVFDVAVNLLPTTLPVAFPLFCPLDDVSQSVLRWR